MIILTLALRYPTTPHQKLYDSTNYHYMASLLNVQGKAMWNLNPLSLFGFYPLAYTPMGGVYFLSGISQLTGLHIEGSILIMNVAWAIIMCLGSFLLGRKIFKSNKIGLFTSFLFISARVTISLTKFTAVVRGFPCSFLPLIFLLMIYSYEYDFNLVFRKKYFVLFILLLITMLATHRLTYLFLPVVVVYPLFQKFGGTIRKRLYPKILKYEINAEDKYPRVIKILLFTSSLIGVIIFSIKSADIFFGRTMFLTESAFFSGSSIHIMVINLFYHVTRQMGLGVIFSLIGFILLSYHRKNHQGLFLYIGLISFIPISIRLAYVYPIWVLFLSLFGGYGIFYLLSKITWSNFLGYIKILFVSFLLLSVIISPYLITIKEPYKKEKTRELYVTDREVITATYLKYHVDYDEGFYIDPGWQSHVFVGISKKRSLGLAGVEYACFNRTLRDNLEVEYMFSSGEELSVKEFLKIFYEEKGNLFYVKNDPLFTRNKYWRASHKKRFIRFYKKDDYYRIINAYNLKIIVLDDRFVNRGQEYISNLLKNEYKTYNSEVYYMFPVSY